MQILNGEVTCLKSGVKMPFKTKQKLPVRGDDDTNSNNKM